MDSESITNCQTFFSPNDIQKGSRWLSEISTELQNSNLGLLFITKDNLSNPWLIFEAGVLSKDLNISRVCPILFNLEITAVTGPLTQFQLTKFSKEEIKNVIKNLNEQAGDFLQEKILDDVFNQWWPNLENEINSILSQYQNKNEDTVKKRTDKEMIEEILIITRQLLNSNKAEPKIVENEFDFVIFMINSFKIVSNYIIENIEFSSLNEIVNFKKSIELIDSNFKFIEKNDIGNNFHKELNDILSDLKSKITMKEINIRFNKLIK